MDIVINTQPFYDFLALPPDEMLLRMIFTFGWFPIAIVFLWGFIEMWVFYIQQVWFSKQKFILLAIDIPRGNEQSPKAVENLFTYIAGAHGSINLLEKYWDGEIQLSFAFEIVSIDGYTQFLIHAPEVYRNLVESAVYSQYPDAEITEVNDYTVGAPVTFPDEHVDIFGSEFIQVRPSAYPIKTYIDFEHQMGEPEKHFRDPMAAMMDLCSSLKPGEQLWYQILITPIGFDWPEIGAKEISKVIGEKVKGKQNVFEKILDGALNFIGEATGIFVLPQPAEEKKEEPPFKMMNLKPEQKRQVEKIQEKVGKLGFEAKVRYIYLARKEVMNRKKVANGVIGFMKQFAWNDLNNLKSDTDVTMTKAAYFFKKARASERKRKLMRHYRNRSRYGRKMGILNVEELATLWHFPIEAVVKAPMIQKAPGRKAEPPMTLPIGEEVRNVEIEKSIFDEEVIKRRPPAPAQISQNPPRLTEAKTDPIFDPRAGGKTVAIEAPPDNLPII